MEKYSELREAINSITLIDNHAHNITSFESSFPFVKAFTEADGDEALSFAQHSLSFKRSLRDLAKLYKCEGTLEEIERRRTELGLSEVSRKCFGEAGIGGVLIDDGIEFDGMKDVEWHNEFMPYVGRIVRVERIAEKILDREPTDKSKWTLDMFAEIFTKTLNSIAVKAVGLKSIAAYRSGLGIDPNVTKDEAEEGLSKVLSSGKPIRIQSKGLIDFIFMRSLDVALCFDLPVQIHTGFGDKDLDLRLSNPLHLRAVLEDKKYSKCSFVLLHASYPFSKEASYLASIYPQVYVDFGLAIPKLSVHGMISCVKELLDLSPIKKVMFSTDGYAFPETFYLAAKRARAVLLSVLCGACDDGDLTIHQAIDAAEDIFKKNAVRLYKIKGEIFYSKSAVSLPIEVKSNISDQDIIFVRVIWVDTSGKHRCRAVPVKRFYDVVKKNGLGLAVACMGMSSSSDGPAEGSNLTAVGETRLIPDLSTKWRIPWAQQEEMVLADMHLKPGEPWEFCPREALRRVSKVLKNEFNLEMVTGFENEFYLLKKLVREGKDEYVPFDLTSYCSSSAFDTVSLIFQEINLALQSIEISVEQLHAESGNGQFEIVLGKSVCNHAADNLIFAREVVRAVARKHGLLATFIPKFFANDIGSGSHVHISLMENGKNIFMGDGISSQYGMSKVGQKFMAGVFYHLPSIMAFTTPLPNSYNRIQPDTWSGAYHCWGKENKEAPLRTACPPGISDGVVSNFEIKAFDGCANPHLGLASIVASGIDGLRRNLSLPEPTDINPSSLRGKLQRLPTELSEAVEALQKNTNIKEFIGEKFITAIIAVRQTEIEYYSKNKDAEKLLIHNY